MTPQELVGKRVRFRTEEDHADCWHCKVGLVGGVVKRPAQTLAEKAEMIRGEGGAVPADWSEEYEEVPRVWVKADPVEGFPNGCEVAVEVECVSLE